MNIHVCFLYKLFATNCGHSNFKCMKDFIIILYRDFVSFVKSLSLFDNNFTVKSSFLNLFSEKL